MNNRIVAVEQIIEDVRLGKKVILIDHNDRENEGDVVVAAEKISPEDINFMMKHCRGIVCLCMTEKDRVRLGLDFMKRSNAQGHHSAHFTTSIEAMEGVSTGVSAYDRYTTIKTAVDPLNTQANIRTPGHVFPIIASDGGVLERKGHTEASITVAGLAGLRPAAVISEVIRNDGHMARLDDLIPFAEEHQINIGFIEDLVKAVKCKNHPVIPAL